MFSRTSLDKLLKKIDRSSVLKDEKIEAVHDLLEQQQSLYLLQFDLQTAPRPDRKSREH